MKLVQWRIQTKKNGADGVIFNFLIYFPAVEFWISVASSENWNASQRGIYISTAPGVCVPLLEITCAHAMRTCIYVYMYICIYIYIYIYIYICKCIYIYV